jgi:hypothetical protein
MVKLRKARWRSTSFVVQAFPVGTPNLSLYARVVETGEDRFRIASKIDFV